MKYLLSMAIVLMSLVPQSQSLPEEFYKIPDKLRERATVVLTGTFGKGRGPCILRPDGTRVWYLDSWFDVKKVYRGKVKSRSVRINTAMLPDSEYVTKSLELEHNYLALLRPDEETMKAMKTESGVRFEDSLRDDEIIAIVELK
jgi:hypothetical protein